GRVSTAACARRCSGTSTTRSGGAACATAVIAASASDWVDSPRPPPPGACGIIRAMVSVTHAVSPSAAAASVELLAEGLAEVDRSLVEQALAYAESIYDERRLSTGESVRTHALGAALIVASLRLDAEARAAALLFAVGDYDEDYASALEQRFGVGVVRLVDGLRRLNGLRLITHRTANAATPEIRAQLEVLRKMLLAMVEDIRVVLLRLASRTQTLRHLTNVEHEARAEIARESLEIYAPLANRLGVWQ